MVNKRYIRTVHWPQRLVVDWISEVWNLAPHTHPFSSIRGHFVLTILSSPHKSTKQETLLDLASLVGGRIGRWNTGDLAELAVRIGGRNTGDTAWIVEC